MPKPSPGVAAGSVITRSACHVPPRSAWTTAAPQLTRASVLRAAGAPTIITPPASATLAPYQPTALAGACKVCASCHPAAVRCSRWTAPGRVGKAPAPGSPMAIQSPSTATDAPKRALAAGRGGRMRATCVTARSGAGPMSNTSTAPASRSGESARGDPTTSTWPSVATAAPNSDAGSGSGQGTCSTVHDPS